MSLVAELRQAAANAAVEAPMPPFTRALLSGSLAPRDYARGLAQWWFVHKAIEEACQADSPATACFRPDMIRTDAIRRDIIELGFDLSQFPASSQAQAIVDQIKRWQASKPWCVLGCFFILESGRLGSRLTATSVRKMAPQTEDEEVGTRYLIESSPLDARRMAALRKSIENLVLSPSQRSEVVEAAGRFARMSAALNASLSIGTKPLLLRQGFESGPAMST